VIALEAGWTFAAAGAGHGTGNPEDQRVPILMMGAGIRPGRYDEPATPADIAPTLAALCELTMPHAQGRVLRSAIAR
jgi:predicted AlkP superfamily pyrophosphatase or phosphodiesterase